MASVFASFILNGDPTIKQFGVGLSVAVLLAGILVVTLAPAILVLFGRGGLVAAALAGPDPAARLDRGRGRRHLGNGTRRNVGR